MELSEVLNELIAKNHIFYHRYCLKYIRRPEWVEECLQEGFEKFLNCGRSFGSSEEAEKYLCRLLGNHFIDHLRLRNRQPGWTEIDPDRTVHQTTVADDPESVMVRGQRERLQSELVRKLAEYVRQLPAHQRELVQLHFFREPPLSCREISRLRRIPVSTVHSRIRSGVKNLLSLSRDLLNQWQG